MTSRYEKRRLEICFASEEELERWRARAGETPLARWAREVVENYLADEELKPRQELELDTTRLREENRNLKRELQKTEAALELAESQLIRLKHSDFLKDEGRAILSAELVNLLLSGCAWPGREIVKELHIAPNDSDAKKIVHAQLETLASAGFIEETPRGWRWKK